MQPTSPLRPLSKPPASWTCPYCHTPNIYSETCPSCGAKGDPLTVQSIKAFPPDTFLFDPANKVYPQQMPHRYAPIFGGCFGIGSALFLIPFFLAGIFIVTEAIKHWNEYNDLTVNARQIQATVTRREIDDDDDGTSYYLYFRYVVNDRTYNGRTSTNKDTYNQTKEGSRVTIIYSRANPQIYQWGSQPTSGTAVMLTGFAFCWNVFIVFFAFAWFGGLFFSARKYRLSQLLYREGIPLTGQVIACEGRIEKDSDGDPYYEVRLRYSFNTPDSRLLTREEKRTRNDLKKQPLPVPGTPVQVLYLDEKRMMVL